MGRRRLAAKLRCGSRVRLGLARRPFVFLPGRWGPILFPGRRQVERLENAWFLEWAWQKRTLVYGLSRFTSRLSFSGRLGRLPGPEWHNRTKPD
jgi:hypothetical protein